MSQPGRERQALEQEIRLIDQLLAETQDRTERTASELAMLNRQLELRERLLGTLTQEIQAHETEIAELDRDVCQIDAEMVQLRDNYAHSVRTLYRYAGTDNVWLAVLSAGSLQEAYDRMQYFEHLTQYQQRQLQALEKSRRIKQKTLRELSAAILEKETLWEEKELEIRRLKDARDIQKSVLATVKAQQNQYQQSLTAQQKFLQNTISSTEEKVTITPDPPPAPEREAPTSAPASSPVSARFKDARGSLPWPIQSGGWVMIQGYGSTEDAFGNRVQSDGLQLRTTVGETVRTVFRGKITAIQRLPTGGFVVIVAHDNFRTVYSGVEGVRVSIGDQLSQGDAIGTVRTDSRSGETVLTFMIYEEPKKFLNPQLWLRS